MFSMPRTGVFVEGQGFRIKGRGWSWLTVRVSVTM